MDAIPKPQYAREVIRWNFAMYIYYVNIPSPVSQPSGTNPALVLHGFSLAILTIFMFEVRGYDQIV